MVWLIQTIDAIARQVQRDVIFLRFTANPRSRAVRKKLRETIEWLDHNKIGWKMTGDFDPRAIWIEGTPTCLYLDVASRTRKMSLVRKKFADADGSPRAQGFLFSRLALVEAMEHSERDDPDFWDNYV